MLKRPQETTLRRWLRAEAAGREAEANTALGTLFQSLPVATPIPGLADQVLIVAGLVRGPKLSWRARGLIAGAMASVGLAFIWLLPVFATVASRLAPGKLVGRAVQGLAGMTQVLAEWLSFWRSIADFVDTLLVVVTAPPVVLTLISTGFLAALLGRGLVELVVSDRSPRYV